MKKFCLIVCSFYCFPLFAQQKVADSLLQELRQHPQQDTVRLHLLNEIAYAYATVDVQKGIQMADEAIVLGTKLNVLLKLAAAYNAKGINYNYSGNDSMAVLAYGKAQELYRRAGDSIRVGNVYHNMGLIYFDVADYTNALNNHLKAYAIFKQQGDKYRMGNSLNSQGVVMFYLADYPAALERYLAALKLFEEIGNRKAMADAFTNVGLMYKNIGKYALAFDYQHKAIAVYRETGNRQGEAGTLGNIGTIYNLQSQPEKALQYYDSALAINRSIGNSRRIASDLSNIGIVYNGMERYPEAVKYLGESLALFRELDEKHEIAGMLLELGKLYAAAPQQFLNTQGITPQQRFTKALQYEREAITLATEIEALELQASVLEALSEVYEKKGASANALAALKQYITLKDSINNEGKTEAINRQAIQFEFDKKEVLLKAEHDKQQAVAAAEIGRQRILRNSIIGGAAGLLIAAGFIFFFYKRKSDADFRAQAASTEMKALRAQMNPHFIFNSLNAISDYVSRHDIKTATDYLSHFAKLMRMTLESSEKAEVPLTEDLAALERYMQLEALRLDHKFSYTISVAEDVDTENTMVPPLILQPFVENSIWHGMAKKDGVGRIVVQVRKEGRHIVCVVEDNGVGRNHHNGKALPVYQKQSLGMKITADRIDILNKTKNVNASVALFDLPEGLRVEVRLPLELSF